MLIGLTLLPERVPLAALLVLLPIGLCWLAIWLWRLSRRRYKTGRRGIGFWLALFSTVSAIACLCAVFFDIEMMGFVLFYRQ